MLFTTHAAVAIATAIIMTFFIMYCPSRVGTKNPDQVSLGRKNSGPAVVTM